MGEAGLTLLIFGGAVCLFGLLKIASMIIAEEERRRVELPYEHYCPALDCDIELAGCRDCPECILAENRNGWDPPEDE